MAGIGVAACLWEENAATDEALQFGEIKLRKRASRINAPPCILYTSILILFDWGVEILMRGSSEIFVGMRGER